MDKPARSRLTLSGPQAINSNEPTARETGCLEADAALTRMTANAQRNRVMISAILKPHFPANAAGVPERIELVAQTIESVVTQTQPDAEGIVSLGLFTDWFLPGQSLALKPAARSSVTAKAA
ncbi:hypothetical protein [uncultured Salinicola sp.]|uniref:hypothetical protein n=1 Tax=uncultured Salinicola sp. TaxID=1193542 RepID=UPI00262BC575|nr:hypothetical protein [uncultured Salinicola sp.]|tara:strand:+ start:1472 stop:1837 length:366 start_codon:yes stop_codon:yes gene_type:complete